MQTIGYGSGHKENAGANNRANNDCYPVPYAQDLGKASICGLPCRFVHERGMPSLFVSRLPFTKCFTSSARFGKDKCKFT